MTTEKIQSNSHISTSEIEKDIAETQSEIDALEKELLVLRENPIQNRLAIYMREGNILRRKDFIQNLNEILEYRKTQV